MCGIAGAFSWGGGPPPDRVALRKVRDHMAARGPDGLGEWSGAGGALWLGHRRLSIIDLGDRSLQPMTSHDGAFVITFNGEIYNYVELRDMLRARGAVFRTTSDTEVILELYRLKGLDFIDDLRGMFAFGLWDVARETLVLARDPYGIKPLYYAHVAGRLTFASSVKALQQDPAIPRDPDSAGVAGFLVFGSVPEPFTVCRAIRALPAGSTMIVDRTGPGPPRRFYSVAAVLREAESPRGGNPAALEDDARAALLDSVRHHLVADVPVGAFLSAGVDSGALVGLMRDAGQTDIRTVTLTYEELAGQTDDEGPLAVQTARLYETRHTTRRVTRDEFEADLPRILESMDQPSIDGVNTWFVSKAAHELGLKVAVSGAGGDELLGGYSTFDLLPRRLQRLRQAARVPLLPACWELVAGLAARLGLSHHPKAAGLLRHGGTIAGNYLLLRGLFLPREVSRIAADADFLREGLARLAPQELLTDVLRDGPTTPFAQVAALESCFYLRNQLLRDTDWAGMAHSLEIRTPFVDQVLLPKVAPLMIAAAGRGGKALLASAPSRPLPPAVVARTRTGFTIPVDRWLSGTLDRDDGRRTQAEPWARRWATHVARSQHLLQ